MAQHQFHLPPFAHWTPDDFVRENCAAIIEARLGWDLTDYGQGDFDAMGLLLFTLRNGSSEDLKHGRGILYAEKIMISRVDQISPMHRHVIKTEDIINRAGGELIVELFASKPNGKIDRKASLNVPCDGVMKSFAAGEKLLLSPGESVTLFPGVWHSFWAENADVLIGEVSTVNDDLTDNIFAEPISRFSSIEEDEAASHLLVSDYENRLR